MPDRRPAEKENTGPMTSIRERNKELILRAASEEFADKGFAAGFNVLADAIDSVAGSQQGGECAEGAETCDLHGVFHSESFPH